MPPVIFVPHDEEWISHSIFQALQFLFRVAPLLHSVGGHRIHLHTHEDGLGESRDLRFAASSVSARQIVQDVVWGAGFCAGDANLT